MIKNNNKVYMHIAPDGRKYIGQTMQDIDKRIGKNGYGYRRCPRLHAAIELFGWDNFETIVLYENLDEKSADLIERKLIREHKTTDLKYGFNMADGGKMEHTDYTPVYQYDLNGNYIDSYESSAVAAERYGIKVYCAVANRRNMAYGFLWSHEKHDKIDPYFKTKPDNMKKCYQYDKDGNYICEFESATEAARKCGTTQSVISAACSGSQKTAAGYQWSYEKHNKINSVNYRSSSCHSRKVFQYDINTGAFLREFPSITSACEYVNHPRGRSCIRRCFNSPTCTAYGYKWALKKADYWSADLVGYPEDK